MFIIFAKYFCAETSLLVALALLNPRPWPCDPSPWPCYLWLWPWPCYCGLGLATCGLVNITGNMVRNLVFYVFWRTRREWPAELTSLNTVGLEMKKPGIVDISLKSGTRKTNQYTTFCCAPRALS